MAKRYEESRQFPGPREQVIQASQEAARRSGFKVKSADDAAGRVEAKAGMSIWSWGENISISVDADNRVNATSESSMGTTLVDYGKNKRNVSRFFTQMTALLTPAQ